MHDTSFDDSQQRQDFLQRVCTVSSQLFAVLSHAAFTSANTHPLASDVCQAARSATGKLLSSERMLSWFRRTFRKELQDQTATFNAEVEAHAKRGAGWAVQREHALPIVHCRYTLPTIVKALNEKHMSSDQISRYDIVLQWVGAMWNSFFIYPQDLLFGQQDVLAITSSHLKDLEARLWSNDIRQKLQNSLLSLSEVPALGDQPAQIQALQDRLEKEQDAWAKLLQSMKSEQLLADQANMAQNQRETVQVSQHLRKKLDLQHV